jgi:hypothetical protein
MRILSPPNTLIALAEWADRSSHSAKTAFMMAQCSTCCESNRLANSHEQHPAVSVVSISMTAGPRGDTRSTPALLCEN